MVLMKMKGKILVLFQKNARECMLWRWKQLSRLLEYTANAISLLILQVGVDKEQNRNQALYRIELLCLNNSAWILFKILTVLKSWTPNGTISGKGTVFQARSWSCFLWHCEPPSSFLVNFRRHSTASQSTFW